MAAALVTLEKSAKGGMQKFFKYVPAVVLCYLIAMLLCTLGVWDMAETKPAYSALKNNLTYAMIFAMLLRCNIRKLPSSSARRCSSASSAPPSPS